MTKNIDDFTHGENSTYLLSKILETENQYEVLVLHLLLDGVFTILTYE